MINWKKAALLTATLLLSAEVLLETGVVEAAQDKTIKEGVYIGSIDVSGMTEAEATSALQSYVDTMQQTTFTLKGAADVMELSAEEMGVTADIEGAVKEALAVANSGSLIGRFKQEKALKEEPVTIIMEIEVDRQQTAELIAAQKEVLDIAAVDNTIKPSDNGFEYIEGTPGKSVNVVDSVYAIEDYLETEWKGTGSSIDLVINEVAQKGDKDQLMRVKDVLGSYSTDYSDSIPSRKVNVANACSKINGTILYPGESLSVYELISPINTANGYETATAYSGTKVIESVGGGVCQVSTTLYNAAIRAEMQIDMRYPHNMTVSYVDPSSDAAISGLSKDMRFTNNTDAPIYIEGHARSGKLSFKIWGEEYRSSTRKVKFVSEVISEDEYETTFKWDSSQPLGYINKEQSGHNGVKARLWKVVTEDGEEVSREIFNTSKYAKSNRIVTFGTKGATSSQLSEIKAAAKAQDEKTARALARKYAAENAAAKKSSSDSSTKSSSSDSSSSEN